jgi:hypothetical protein
MKLNNLLPIIGTLWLFSILCRNAIRGATTTFTSCYYSLCYLNNPSLGLCVSSDWYSLGTGTLVPNSKYCFVALGFVFKNTTNYTLLVRDGDRLGNGGTCSEFCTWALRPGQYFGQSGTPYFLKCYDARNALNYLRLTYNNSLFAVPQDVVDCMPTTCADTSALFYPLHLEYTNGVPSPFTEGAVTTVNCVAAYVFADGSSTQDINCLLGTANWTTPSVSCILIANYCSIAPTGPTNSYPPTVYNRTLGSTLVYTCTLGYSGSPNTTCNVYNYTVGYWENMTTANICNLIANYCLTASAPSLLNGVATSFNTTVNSSSNYKCSFGYFGSPYIICNPFSSTNGQWSSINGNCTVIANYCPSNLPTPISFSLAPNTGTFNQSIGSLAGYSCNLGYSGSINTTCSGYTTTNGIWSNLTGSCTIIANYCPSNLPTPISFSLAQNTGTFNQSIG